MARVADPVHEAQGGSSEEAVAAVVLDEERVPGDARGLSQEHHRVHGVMQDVDEQDNVKVGVVARDCAIEMSGA